MTSLSFDLIVISNTIDDDLRHITQNTIDSAIKGVRHNSTLNVILVETSDALHEYQHVNEMILYKGHFMYNKALNLGLTKATGDFHILANSDLYFHPGWDAIGELMRLNSYLSACCLSQDIRQRNCRSGDYIYEGYLVGKHLPGWCIFLDNKILQIIGKLPELHEFWYSDNDYAAQLKACGIKHALIACCQVDHVHNGGQTLAKVDKLTKQRYTRHSRRTL